MCLCVSACVCEWEEVASYGQAASASLRFCSFHYAAVRPAAARPFLLLLLSCQFAAAASSSSSLPPLSYYCYNYYFACVVLCAVPCSAVCIYTWISIIATVAVVVVVLIVVAIRIRRPSLFVIIHNSKLSPSPSQKANGAAACITIDRFCRALAVETATHTKSKMKKRKNNKSKQTTNSMQCIITKNVHNLYYNHPINTLKVQRISSSTQQVEVSEKKNNRKYLFN